jgi:hypothetical protein
MAIGLSDILAALQNGVTSINNLATAVGKVFPQTTASSSTVTAGTVTFTSSQAAGFMIVQTSSGATVKIPYYPQ